MIREPFYACAADCHASPELATSRCPDGSFTPLPPKWQVRRLTRNRIIADRIAGAFVMAEPFSDSEATIAARRCNIGEGFGARWNPTIGGTSA